MTELELLPQIIICGKCGTESDSLWCGICWEVMTHFEKSTPIPAYRCIYCEYPEPTYLVSVDKYCTGCGIKYGVKLIPVPKKKVKQRNISYATTTATDTIHAVIYY